MQRNLKKAELKAILPAPVWAKVEGWMKAKRKRASSVWLEDMTGRKLYFDEDHRYQAFRNGAWSSVVRTGGEWGGFIKNDPIGKQVDVPTGTWIVETGYFLGEPTISVMNWGEAQERLGK